MADQLLTTAETAAQLGYAVQTLRNWRSQGLGPDFIKVNGKTVRYRQSAVTAWIERHQGRAKKTDSPRRMY